MTNSTLSMSYCAGDTVSRVGSGLPVGSAEKSLTLDVRRAAAMAATPKTIPGAMLASDLSDLSNHASFFAGVSKVRLFCVHGYERSISAAIILRGFGCQIEDIAGGLEGFEEAGGETVSVVKGKTGVLGSPRLWLFHDTIADAFVAWVVARFIDPLSSYRFVSEAHEEKVLVELKNAGLDSVFFQQTDGDNKLDALLEEFDFQNFSILTDTVIPFLQQPATSDLLRGVSCDQVLAFCDHVWTTANLKTQKS